MNKRIVKVTLIVILILCLFEMPYWYYQLVRIFGTIGFAYLSYSEYKFNIKYTPLIYGIAAIVFNPIIRISFDKDAWQVVDIISIIILFINLLLEKRIVKYSKTPDLKK